MRYMSPRLVSIIDFFPAASLCRRFSLSPVERFTSLRAINMFTALGIGCMLSALCTIYIFLAVAYCPHFALFTCFPRALHRLYVARSGIACSVRFPALALDVYFPSLGYKFPRACYHLHVSPAQQRYMFLSTWHRMCIIRRSTICSIFPRFHQMHVFPMLSTGCIFPFELRLVQYLSQT